MTSAPDPTVAGWRPASLACKHGDVTALLALFAQGVSPEVVGGASREPLLHVAVLRRAPFAQNQALIEAVLTAGAKVDGADKVGRTALYYAAENNLAEACEYLIRRGADIEAQDIHGLTPLLVAARFGGIEAIRVLLAGGANPNHRASAQTTALHEAVSRDAIDIVRGLVVAGANPSILPDDGGNFDYLTPCQLAAAEGAAQSLRFFVMECNESLEQRTINHRTLEEIAAKPLAKARLLSLETELVVLSAFDTASACATPVRASTPSL